MSAEMTDQHLTISRLCAELTRIQAEHGDLLVHVMGGRTSEEGCKLKPDMLTVEGDRLVVEAGKRDDEDRDAPREPTRWDRLLSWFK